MCAERERTRSKRVGGKGKQGGTRRGGRGSGTVNYDDRIMYEMCILYLWKKSFFSNADTVQLA